MSTVRGLVEAVASGVSLDELRNRLQEQSSAIVTEAAESAAIELMEGVRKKGIADVLGLVPDQHGRRMTDKSILQWFLVNERTIREELRGEVEVIEAAYKVERFGVLATRFAPEDASAYLGRLRASMRSVMSLYQAEAKELDALVLRMEGARVVGGRSVAEPGEIARGVGIFTRGVLVSLMRSLRRVCNEVTATPWSVHLDDYLYQRSGGVRAIAAVHDTLAEGLQDITLARRLLAKCAAQLEGEEHA